MQAANRWADGRGVPPAHTRRAGTQPLPSYSINLFLTFLLHFQDVHYAVFPDRGRGAGLRRCL